MKNGNIHIAHYNGIKEAVENNEDVNEAEKELFDTRIGIANRVIKLREEAGHMRQNELADLLLISSNHLSRIENGTADFSIANIYDMSQIFGVSTDYILFGKEDIVIDSEIADILKNRTVIEKKRVVKLLKAHFGLD